MALMAASTARVASAARLRGRSFGACEENRASVGAGRGVVVPGEETHPGEVPVVWVKMKGRPTKMSLSRSESLRWALERKLGLVGVASRVWVGREYHQARRDWQMSTMRSKYVCWRFLGHLRRSVLWGVSKIESLDGEGGRYSHCVGYITQTQCHLDER